MTFADRCVHCEHYHKEFDKCCYCKKEFTQFKKTPAEHMAELKEITDEMDEVEYPAQRYELVAFCLSCFEWHHFTGSKNRFLQLHGEVCKCGGRNFTEMRSERSWNETWAKPTAAKLKTKALKARRK